MRALPRPDALTVQAVIAGALSFAHLHDIAEAAGQRGWKAWAYPVSVDLLLVAAWRRLRSLRAAEGPVRAAWLWFAVALAASLGANVATAGLMDPHHVPAWLRVLVAGWPALAFLGGTLLVHAPAPAPAAPDSPPAPDGSPAPAGSSPPAQPPAVLAGPPVPAALLDHARKVADAHRAATGAPIDPATLRARLGVPAPLADAIAARLT
ncbi:DUF2637 domain-containing protein [Streptomyces sp. B1866]|uniref:DUF2637 domain-containing protein n=1 Tax=Streptomyces sp. B1866 TaxID=3075431 RepID=UPI00288E72EF|nr:DUF2637 domain-containing protein [Streptomyces sp. B1866]MDT3397203.1 DUF2637 domain-containing protein [Streptomyces sp. B1866]